jgi:coat protein Gp5
MANVFQNPVMYTNECLRILRNEIIIGKKVSRKHQMEFAKDEMKIGDTLNVRRPARFTVSTGAAFDPQAYTETSIPLVVDQQKHVDTAFTSADMTLKMQDFSGRILKPKMVQMSTTVDQSIYLMAKNAVGNLTGTAGTAPNSLQSLFDLGKKLDDFSTPRDGSRYYALDQGSNASLVPSLAGFFNEQKAISAQYKEGQFIDGTNTVGLKIAMSQNVARHTVGPLGGSPATNGANQGLTSGWSNTGTLITNGWTSAAAQRVAAGDVFTAAGCFAVNPVTRQSTGELLQFVCIQDQSSDGSGNLTLNISPAIITAGPFQNCTASPTSGGALTFVGTASTSYVRNIAWHEDAFELAMVKLVDLAQFGGWGAVRSEDGFALRVFRQAAISTDTVGNRVDGLWGSAAVYPELASQQVGA